MTFLIVIASAFALLAAANLLFGRLPKKPAPPGRMLPFSGGSLHAIENTGDGLPVVFIHGMPGICREFDPVCAELGELETLAIDRPGYAWSKGRPLSFEGQLDAIAEALSTAGYERVMLVGHSFGGMASLGLAIRHPELVDRMLLLAPAVGGTRIGPQRVRQAKLIRVIELPVVRQLADLMFLRLLRKVASRAGAISAYGSGPETAPQRFVAEAVLARHNSINALANDRILFNDAERWITANLAKITAPSLILHGDRDFSVPLRNGRRLAEALPNSQLEELAGDHQLPAKNTAEVVDAVRRLLRQPSA